MKSTSVAAAKRLVTFFAIATTALLLHAMQAHADPITPAMAEKVEHYKAKLVQWAAEPVVIKAAKEGNTKGPIPGMNNFTWEELKENDPVVLAFQTSAAGQWVKKIETSDKALAKLYIRTAAGHLVAGSSKPLIYDVASRPTFKGAIEGKPWSAKEAKPDPTTQEKAIQISVPILDDGKIIGVLHSAVIMN